MSLLRGHFQNAYVTRDVDLAVEQFRAEFGVQDWFSHAGEMQVQTASGRGPLTNKVAVGWADGLQYELIQPITGEVEIYTDALRGDVGLRFHHVGMRVRELDSVRQEMERLGLPIVLEGDMGVRFFYADARDRLGHYLEFVEMPDEIWRLMGGR